MNIEKYIKEAHEIAVEKGFYDCPECGNPVVKCSGAGECDHDGTECTHTGNCGEFEPKCKTCHGTGIDPNKNIGELLMLIVSELGEALEAHRKGRFAVVSKYLYSLDDFIEKLGGPHQVLLCEYFTTNIKDTFEDEIADVFIRLFDLCGYLGISLTYRTYRLHQYYREWGNVGADLFYLSCKLPPDTGYDNFEITSLDLIFSLLYDFSQHHNIPIEKHIEAKMAYNRTRPHKHGKNY